MSYLPLHEHVVYRGRLLCESRAECGRVATEANYWSVRGLDENCEWVRMYCPTCAQRERHSDDFQVSHGSTLTSWWEVVNHPVVGGEASLCVEAMLCGLARVAVSP